MQPHTHKVAFHITIWAPTFQGAINTAIACFGKGKKKEKEQEDEVPAQLGIPLEVFGVAGAAGTTDIVSNLLLFYCYT